MILVAMGWIRNLFTGTPLVRAQAQAYSAAIHPPRREDLSERFVSVDQATSLPSVYRALDILATSAGQVPLTIERGGETLSPAEAGSILAKPSLTMSQSEFVVDLVMSLVTSGNAYIRRVEVAGKLIELQVLNAHEVAVLIDPETDRRTGYSYRGRRYSPREIQHITRMRMPGRTYGLGPIQAAQSGLSLALDQNRFAHEWFQSSGMPPAVLKSKERVPNAELIAARNAFNGYDEDGQPLDVKAPNPTRVKILNAGLDLEQLLITPKDALWLEAQNFSTLEIARLFGVPSSLMLVTLEGNSQTYSNVEQEWLAYTRFTLMGYLRPIENALTEISPAGQRVKFNLEGLLRADTATRMQTHEVAIRSGLNTPNERRAMEGDPPAPGGDRLQLPNVNESTPKEPIA